ncbi:uncharacterized protein E0L32_000218 [Thyridium curvatum]|uniref:AAA+ ATPase domain-containing protein n=1 Tax=Thyridium curvatum TaxID=1093900 RepID=A0A507BB78_9PEZI|nr:uncharacterized protein E0L32_000218 [Thyridium curvatum]TPX15884.1 hypothetical protein E0L32_000218 [Thyridium curvatum]
MAEEKAKKVDESVSNNEAPADCTDWDDERDDLTTKPEASGTVIDEIKALKERLLFLEKQCSGGLILDEEELPPERMQQARRARKWVQKAETEAERTAEERADFGKGKSDIQDDHGMFKIQKGLYHISKPRAGKRYFLTARAASMFEKEMDKLPIEGLRIPTSLRPPDLSKLGARSQWDESDSDAWDSDESTRTRDFDYFQARLRGDFEWEVDRLNMQRKRYAEFKKKKQLKDDLKLWNARAGQVQIKDGDGNVVGSSKNNVSPSIESLTQGDLPGLLIMDWNGFSAVLLSSSRPFSSAIIILEGEPKISTSVSFLRHMFRPPVAKNTSEKAEPEYDGHTVLPERICIFSEPLIRLLSELTESEISPGNDIQNPSVVLLRPYRLLTHYDIAIRKMHETLTGRVAELNTALPEDGKLDPSPVPATPAPTLADLDDAGGNQPDVPAGTNSLNTSEEKTYSKAKEDLQHLSCLISFMDNYLSKRITWLKSVHCEKIHFSDIWHIYKPGDFVISANGKQVYQVAAVDSGQHRGKDPYSIFGNRNVDEDDRMEAAQNAVISCVYISYDGTLLGPVVEPFLVKRFDGERSITTLEVLPLRYHVMKMPEVARRLAKFEGDAQIRALETEIEIFREELACRGRKFVSVAAVKHMDYAGLTADKRDDVESQVMIDVQEAFAVEENADQRPKFSRVHGTYTDKSSSITLCNSECCFRQNIHLDTVVQAKAHEDFVAAKLEKLDSSETVQPPVSLVARNVAEVKADGSLLTTADFMIMSYSVFGFVLRNRSWSKLDLDFLSDIDKAEESAEAQFEGTHTKDSDDNEGGDTSDDSDNDDGSNNASKTTFSQLVLPPGHKKMVLSLVSQHFRNKESFKRRNEKVDIVKGKGKGLIILLHGAPGVGKTTTAEGVAETFGKPLFQITCGDLGTNAEEVEESLQKTFALASRWDCILLLDEADVFLAARRRDDFTRNGLVAVFLRVLEYYAGILFLTTNRVGDLDEAFTSRIHMILHYPQLDRVSTGRICRLNLNMIRDRYKAAGRHIKIDQDEIEDHVREYWDHHKDARWNGRQIRNACQTALALAEYDTQPKNKKHDLAEQTHARVHLKVRHVKRVSKAYLAFLEYLRSIHGTDSETRARELGLRALERVIGEATMAAADSFGERLRRRDGTYRGREAAAQHRYSFRDKFRPDLSPRPQQPPQQQPYPPAPHDPYMTQDLPQRQTNFAPQRQFPSHDPYTRPPALDPQSMASIAGASGYGPEQDYATASRSPRMAPAQTYGPPREQPQAHDVPRYGAYPRQGNVPDYEAAPGPSSYQTSRPYQQEP